MVSIYWYPMDYVRLTSHWNIDSGRVFGEGDLFSECPGDIHFLDLVMIHDHGAAERGFVGV